KPVQSNWDGARPGAFNTNCPHGWETSAACAAAPKPVENPKTERAKVAIKPTVRARARGVWSLAAISKSMAVAPVRSTVPLCYHSGRPPRARAPHAGRMTCSGRSPGSRVVTLLRLPKLWCAKPSGKLKKDSPPTVAGAAPDLLRQRMANRTGFPFGRSTRPAHLNMSDGKSRCDLCQRPEIHFPVRCDI